MNDRTLTLLKGARERLAKEKNWTQGTWARSKRTRRACDIDSPSAGSWCLVGALQIEAKNANMNGLDISSAERALSQTIAAACPGGMIHPIGYNDMKERKHEQILQLLDMTIERIEAKAKK